MTRFVDCASCCNWVYAGEGVCLRCGTPIKDYATTAALMIREAGETASASPLPRPDRAPAGVLGSVPHGPVWSVIPDVADGIARFRLSGPGVALMLAADQAAALGIELMRAVQARRVG